MGPRPATIAEAVEWLRKRFRPDAARDLSIAYQMELSGEGGGVLSACIADGRLKAVEGGVEQPDVVYRLSADDFFGILAGSANPDLLFMDEKIQIEGDLSLALKLRTLFRSGA